MSAKWSHGIAKVTSDEGEVFSVLEVWRPNRERTRTAVGIGYVSPLVLERKSDPTARAILAAAWREARKACYAFLRKQARAKHVVAR